MRNSSLLPLLDQEYQSTHPFATLKRLLRIPTWRLPLYVLLFVIKNSPALMMPLYLEQMVRFAKDPSLFPQWWFWTINAGYLCLLLQNIPTHLLFVRLVHKHIRGMERRLRASLVARLQQLSIRFHDSSESGRLQSKLLRDVEAVVQMTINLSHSGISTFCSIVWGVSITFYTDSKIGIFFLFGAPLAALIIYSFRRRLAQHNREYRHTFEHMSSRMSEMIDSIAVSRAHAEEDKEMDRAVDTLNHVYQAGMQIDRSNHFFGAASFVSMQISIITVIAVTTWLVASGTMPLERIMLYYGLFGLVVNALVQLLSFTPVISTGFEAMRSIGEILECPDIEYNQGKKFVKSVQGEIRFDHVDFSYTDSQPILKDFNFTIQAGECVAFVGESGSGKSTLMNLAIGFYRPQKGRILLDGHDSNDLDLRSWRSHIAVVPQQTILFSGSIRDNITYGHDYFSEQQIWDAIDAANLREVIDSLPQGLDTLVGENGSSLSGGQRQRLAIARALVRDPKVIILDEATSALDVISERSVQDAIDKLIEGRTVLIVAHRLSTIRKAKHVVVMKNGHCIEHGEQGELIKRNGEFSRLKQLQS